MKVSERVCKNEVVIEFVSKDRDALWKRVYQASKRMTINTLTVNFDPETRDWIAVAVGA